MSSDMLVKLYNLEDREEIYEKLNKQGISIKRAMPEDGNRVVQFVKNNFGDDWARGCSYSFTNHPVSCFIAVSGKKTIGFACYDTEAKNFFGPIGVYEKFRGAGIGEALLRRCLGSMESDGYGYAVVGRADGARGFFEKTVDATVIENSFPGIYRNRIAAEEQELEYGLDGSKNHG